MYVYIGGWISDEDEKRRELYKRDENCDTRLNNIVWAFFYRPSRSRVAPVLVASRVRVACRYATWRVGHVLSQVGPESPCRTRIRQPFRSVSAS